MELVSPLIDCSKSELPFVLLDTVLLYKAVLVSCKEHLRCLTLNCPDKSALDIIALKLAIRYVLIPEECFMDLLDPGIVILLN